MLSTSTGTPDAAGLAYWVNQMQNGLSDEQLEAGFIGSAEFIADHGGGNNTLFVMGLYETLLGRSPQSNEVQYWVDQLNNGVTPQQVALDFTTSPEREAHACKRITSSTSAAAPAPPK